MIEKYIHDRSRELIHIIEYGLEKKKKETVEQNIITINSNFLGYSYQYTGDEWLGGRCQIMKDNS